MEYKDKIVDKQVGRNSDLYAQSIAELKTPEERYPHLRILVSIIEQAHPEWNQAPHKDRQVANIVFKMSRAVIGVDEVAEIVRLRDAERGYGPLPDDDRSRRSRNPRSESDDQVSNSKADAANAAKADSEKADSEQAEAKPAEQEKPAPRTRKRPASKKAEASSDDAAKDGDKPEAVAGDAKSDKPEAEARKAPDTEEASETKEASASKESDKA